MQATSPSLYLGLPYPTWLRRILRLLLRLLLLVGLSRLPDQGFRVEAPAFLTSRVDAHCAPRNVASNYALLSCNVRGTDVFYSLSWISLVRHFYPAILSKKEEDGKGGR